MSVSGSGRKNKQKLFNKAYLANLELEAKKYFMKFIRWAKTPNDYKLKVVLNVGKQGMGKTKFQEAFAWWIYTFPPFRGLVHCPFMKDIRTIYNDKYRDYWKLPVQVLLFDDAARVFDSHESMKNTKKLQDYFDIRHIFKEECKYGDYGIIFMVVNIQTLRRIEVSIRDTYDLMIIQNYFDTDWFEKKIRTPELKEFCLKFTEKASSFNMEQEKRLCIGRTLTKKEFKWSIPIEDYDVLDPHYDKNDPHRKKVRIKDLLKKYNIINYIGIDTVEQEIQEKLKRRLFHHEYFELKTVKQLKGWLKRMAREKYDAEKYRIEFSDKQLNELIEEVDDLRFHNNLARKQDFNAWIQENLSLDQVEKISKLEYLAKAHARKENLFFLKDKEITEMVKELVYLNVPLEQEKEQEYMNSFDPNEELGIKEKIINAFRMQNKLLDIDRIKEITGLEKGQIYNALKTHDIFKNVVKGKGVYCLKGFKFDQVDLEPYITKPLKKLKMES